MQYYIYLLYNISCLMNKFEIGSLDIIKHYQLYLMKNYIKNK